jgi:cytidylate kinase
VTFIPVVAIDGPAAAGKTVLGRALAAHFGWTFFDTGVLYRALTWKALQNDADLADGAALVRLAGTTAIEVQPSTDPGTRAYDVIVDGQDVSAAIREPRVDRSVSQVSAHAEVRNALIQAQRSLRKPPGIVMAGRDIGTVIFPDALVKIYLDASPEVRARRRAIERGARSDQETAAELRAVRRRDRTDSARDAAPLRAAPDARVLDTDHLDVNEVVEHAIRLTTEALARLRDDAPSPPGRGLG